MTGVLAEVEADVTCLTEGFEELLPGGGHVVAGSPHGGFPDRPGQRRVLLWSRSPWREVDEETQHRMPHEGFVSAVTDTPAGRLRMLGLCIPWHLAGVRDCQGKRAWESHRAFLRL